MVRARARAIGQQSNECLRQRKMTLHLERPSETVVETETKLSQWAGGSVWHVEEVEERNASTG